MKPGYTLPFLAIGLLILSSPVHADGAGTLLPAESYNLQKLWDGPGGTSVVVTVDGSVLAFEGTSGNRVLRSIDGGVTWNAPVTIGSDAFDGNALVDEVSGHVLYVNPADNALWRSTNDGQSWQKETITIAEDGLGNKGLDVRYMQPGITLQNVSWPPYGSDQRGRLIMPARVLGPDNSDAPDWRIYHYATSIYSDDGGSSWVTSIPFPIMGAADGAIAELTYGGLLFSAREQITRGNRYLATSPNNGVNWIAADRNADIPDGPRGSSFGLMGGLIRLPIDGYDVLLYSNVDTDSGSMPAEFAGDSTDGRERITVWASFDGGQTWPIQRVVYDGPSGISNLAAGRAGTATEGEVFLLFEGGPDGSDSAVHLATFNLSWLLGGEDVNDYLIELVEPEPFPAIYWTGEVNNWSNSQAWSSLPYNDLAFPAFRSGVSSNESFRFYHDFASMSGSNSSVRMNRDNVTIVSLNLAGEGNSGFAFTNADNNGDGLMLAGPIMVLGGVHGFLAPTPGRTIELMTDSTWTIAEDATLFFGHVLSGEQGLTKDGPGTLRIIGDQLYTGETSVERGAFGVGFGPASLAGSLYFEPGALLLFDPVHTLSVSGNVSFEENFGVANIDGLDANVDPGTYQLIAGNVNSANLDNLGLTRAAPISTRKWAYLGTGGGLTVTIVEPVSLWDDLPSENGWKMTVAGWITDEFYPLVYHHTAGWFRVHPDASLEGYYAYDFTTQSWIWGAENLGGWRFNFDAREWETWE
jgi:sialidase-1